MSGRNPWSSTHLHTSHCWLEIAATLILINQFPSSCCHLVSSHTKQKNVSTSLNQKKRNIESERAVLHPDRRSNSSHQQVCWRSVVAHQKLGRYIKVRGRFFFTSLERSSVCQKEILQVTLPVQGCLHGRQWWIVWFLEWTLSGAGCHSVRRFRVNPN